MHTYKKSAFSLVELSIVLVILGLLTGGILAGQNLIKAAELRAVTEEFAQWQTATNSFRQKYFALPGDLRNATQFWGSANGANCFGPINGLGSGTQTCNGDGNGQITYGGMSNAYVEMFMFWQHLYNAGLINQEMSGRSGPYGRDNSIIGTNSPKSRFGNAGWSVFDDLFPDNTDPQDNFTIYGTKHSGWPMIFGGQYNRYELYTPVLTPAEAWNIDTKIDDGKADTGIVVPNMYHLTTPDCDDGNTPFAYDLANENIVCTLIFRP